MSINPKDIVLIPISKEMETTATYLAQKRALYEYPRKGYGDYDTRDLAKIKVGIIGELAFLEFVQKILLENTTSLKSEVRWQVLHEKIQFSYVPVIGNFDGGFEFELLGKTIDIKTYENHQVRIAQIFHGLKENGKPLNLMIDASQSLKADIYIQAFLTQNNEVSLAGYHKGVPGEPQKWMPQPAYVCPVPNLQPLEKLKNSILKKLMV